MQVGKSPPPLWGIAARSFGLNDIPAKSEARVENSQMTQKLSDAMRRADCMLAGAVFLSLSTVAAVASYNPSTDHMTAAPSAAVAIVDAAAAPAPAVLPDVVPMPRPAYARLRIAVALANLVSEGTCLAEAMYYEARGEGLAGEKAIAEVVLHRTHRAGFPRSICGVVHQGEGQLCQFSFVCDGAMERPRTASDWRRSMRLATRILTGSLPLNDTTGGAIAFHTVAVQPEWPGLVRTVQIGNHIFYRRPSRNPSI